MARDSGRLADAIEEGRSVLTERNVLPGVVRAVPEVRVEAVFDDTGRTTLDGELLAAAAVESVPLSRLYVP